MLKFTRIIKTLHSIKYKNILLRSIIEDDLEYLRLLRNNKNVSLYLSKIGEIDKQKQSEWYRKVIESNDSFTFAIVETKELNKIVGSCSIYDIEDNEAEFGKIMIDSNARGKKVGYNSMFAALYYGFNVLNLIKMRFTVFNDNVPSKTIALKMGYKIVSEKYIDNMKQLSLILDKDDYFSMYNEETNKILVQD